MWHRAFDLNVTNVAHIVAQSFFVGFRYKMKCGTYVECKMKCGTELFCWVQV